ncbi:MFS transporter [Sphingobium bisphenolivorans]|uniref:MFS transporter n=1 Tax=Sphingobium bisphenolivorans TaxID=1335760 RepID=UPI00126A03E9|nr:MFS transporter [Sphingobium bisphenolivorans]
MSDAEFVTPGQDGWHGLKRYTGFLITLWLAEMTGSFESTMVIAAMRYLIEDFGDPAKIGWLITAYLIVGAAAAAVVGRLGDLFGRRRILIIVLVTGLVGSIVSAVAPSFAWLLAGRILQGITTAILPLCIGIVREDVPPQHVPMSVGLMISGASLGNAAGLVLGGWIVDNYSWHGVFMASALFCSATIVGVLACVPRSPHGGSSRGIDWLSGVLFAPGTMLVLYYVSSITKKGLDYPVGLMAFGMGAVLLAYWGWRSLKDPNPLLDIRQFTIPHVVGANLVTALAALGSMQGVLVFSILLQTPAWTGIGLGATAFVAGLAKLPSSLLGTFASPLSGWLTGRGGGRNAMLVGGAVSTAGWIFAYCVHDTVEAAIIALCIISFGAAMLFAVAPTILAQAVPKDRTSEISGMLTVVRSLFVGIGAMLITILLATDVVLDPASKALYPSAAAFELTFLVIIVLNICATLSAFTLPARSKETVFVEKGATGSLAK